MPDDVLGTGDPAPGASKKSRAIPMQIGNATVFIESSDEPMEVEPSDRLYAVAMISPKDAFNNALAVIKECVGGIGQQLEELAAKLRPDELSAEFSVQFEASGKGAIPVLVTTEAKATGGIKVTALWRHSDKKV
jgi:hypothetical protein